MNNGIVSYNQSREPRIYLEIVPLAEKMNDVGSS